jgi:hypothetical protein
MHFFFLNGSCAQLLIPRPTANFAYYFPRIYNYYEQTMATIHKTIPSLPMNFTKSIFPGASFNCGPHTFTKRHLDNNNLAHGLCAVFAGGNYDYKKGGQMILFDLKLIIEFPPGTSMLIPSGSLPHGNIPIQPGETRVSFTQYCAGGLVRWVRYGCQTWKDLKSSTTPEGMALVEQIEKEDGTRWKWAMNLFSSLDSLKEDLKQVFPHGIN